MAELRQSFGFPLSVATLSDVGRVRDNNEDASGTTWLDDGSLFVIVADGMGGHEAGEVASGLAVRVVEDAVLREPDADPRGVLYNALIEANQAIIEEASASGTRGMGTTAITAVLRGHEVYVALVGDSRCYQVRKGHAIWRTLDHTRVQMLVDAGEIGEDAARGHPEAGMLTRALGHARMADGRTLEPDVLAEPLHLEEGDALLLCSDGLHDLVEDWEIGQVLAGRSPEQAAGALVDLACDRGGHDNVTVAVITAGSRSADYDPHYVPPGYDDPVPEETQPDIYGSADAGGWGESAEPYAEPARPVTASTGVMDPAAAGAFAGGGPVAVAGGPVAHAAPEDAREGNKGMMIGLAVAGALLIGVVLLLAVSVGLYFFM